MDLADLRIDYAAGTDAVRDTDDPIALFGSWLQEAVAAGGREPNAMALGTIDPEDGPSVRMVLLRQIREGDFVFYTNIESPKALALRRDPRCALMFWWAELERQVRVTGRASALPREDAAAYFATRPRSHQIGAWASPQSRPMTERAELETRFAEAEARFEGQDVPLPPHWGGFSVTPIAMEFWQGRPSRLHERVRFEREGSRWLGVRLSP